VSLLKILGVTITDKLFVSDHVQDVVRKCAQSLHVIRVLRCHGMNDQALQAVYRSVVLAKLVYASSAWWGFKQTAIDTLFSRLLSFEQHVLHGLVCGGKDSVLCHLSFPVMSKILQVVGFL